MPENTAATLDPAAVLLARLWSIEDGDGGWSGGDTIEIVCEWLTRQGFNIDHPAESGADLPYASREDWDYDELVRVAQAQLDAKR